MRKDALADTFVDVFLIGSDERLLDEDAGQQPDEGQSEENRGGFDTVDFLVAREGEVKDEHLFWVILKKAIIDLDHSHYLSSGH